MILIIWIIVSVIVFSTIILVHEYGHFKTARIFWVKVEEFWLGIPPKAKKLWTDKHGTIYTLNWLPLWWFVRLKWESINTFLLFDKDKKLHNNVSLEKAIKSWEDIFNKDKNLLKEEDKKDILKKLHENFATNSLLTKKAWQQAIIILAWVFMNFVLAIFIFSFLFFIWVSPIRINNKIEISQESKLIPNPENALKNNMVLEWVIIYPINWSIAEKSWLKNFDFILKINWDKMKSWLEIKNIISNKPNTSFNLEVKRYNYDNCNFINDDCKFEIKNISVISDYKWAIWIWLGPLLLNKDFKYKYWVLESIKYWTLETYSQIILTFKALKILIQKIFNPKTETERQEAINQVSWPIGVIDFMSKSITNWVIFILIIWAILSINLWVFNLLPIPALDWWRFLFIVINSTISKIFWRKAINEQLEWGIHIIFFIFLIALSILIAYNDVSKIINWN